MASRASSAPALLRIVANNPNHFTFKGTNTYLVGTAHVSPSSTRVPRTPTISPPS